MGYREILMVGIDRPTLWYVLALTNSDCNLLAVKSSSPETHLQAGISLNGSWSQLVRAGDFGGEIVSSPSRVTGGMRRWHSSLAYPVDVTTIVYQIKIQARKAAVLLHLSLIFRTKVPLAYVNRCIHMWKKAG